MSDETAFWKYSAMYWMASAMAKYCSGDVSVALTVLSLVLFVSWMTVTVRMVRGYFNERKAVI